MASRLELHEKLKELLGSNNVYYQPPNNIKMSYPAIKYSKDLVSKKRANNGTYLLQNRYQIVVIDKVPDNPVIEKLLKIPMCDYVRTYSADNLNHDVLSIYF